MSINKVIVYCSIKTAPITSYLGPISNIPIVYGKEVLRVLLVTVGVTFMTHKMNKSKHKCFEQEAAQVEE